jgi:hypothetical protein
MSGDYTHKAALITRCGCWKFETSGPNKPRPLGYEWRVALVPDNPRWFTDVPTEDFGKFEERVFREIGPKIDSKNKIVVWEYKEIA